MTAQMHELLIYEGEDTSMAFCPPIPTHHPRISEQPEDPTFFHTACWRRYLGTWEIRDGHFYLVKLEGVVALEEGSPLFADWFTGTLRIPKGKRLHYVHMGFGSVYEEEIHVKIENGVVVEKKVIDNRDSPHDLDELGWRNLPGHENRFAGDDEF